MCNCDNCESSITSTQGAKGNKGDTGATGAQGAQGATGATGSSGAASTVTVVTSATYTPSTPTSATGTDVYLNRAAGITVSLPVSPPLGTTYTFYSEVSPTPGSYTINAGTGDFLLGFVYSNKSAADPIVYTANAAGTDTHVTMNGTTTGGLVGTAIKFSYIDETNNFWFVSGTTLATGAQASLFS